MNYKLKYNFKVKNTKKINFNNFKIKEISRNNGITNETLYIITNSNDNIIGIEEQILDLKVYDNVLMIVVGGIHQLRVEYIYSLPNTPLFAIGYGIPVTITPNANLKVVSAKILSDNYIKCVFNDRREEIWRCVNSEECFKENYKLKDKKAFITKLVWANDLNQFKYNLKSIECKSYDFIEQYTEPTIEQLKKKFPDDTFFGDTVGDKKETNNTIIEKCGVCLPDNNTYQKNIFCSFYGKCKSFFTDIKNRLQV